MTEAKIQKRALTEERKRESDWAGGWDRSNVGAGASTLKNAVQASLYFVLLYKYCIMVRVRKSWFKDKGDPLLNVSYIH